MKFSIDQIASYLAGWTIRPFDEVKAAGRETYFNALSQLRDPQDGIEAVTKRSVDIATRIDMEAAEKANAIFKAKTWGWQYLRLERFTVHRTDSWASGTFYGIKVLCFKFCFSIT